MTKYIIFLAMLIIAGGLFLYTTQTAEAPERASAVQENPFGDPPNDVSLPGSSSSTSERR